MSGDRPLSFGNPDSLAIEAGTLLGFISPFGALTGLEFSASAGNSSFDPTVYTGGINFNPGKLPLGFRYQGTTAHASSTWVSTPAPWAAY